MKPCWSCWRSPATKALARRGGSNLHWLLAALVASTITMLDLDRTFYVPAGATQRLTLWAWWWLFVVLNGLLAVGTYLALRHLEPFAEWSPWVSAGGIGMTYLALMRLKFSTFTFQGKEVPFGIEFFYEAAKEAVFRRINAIARSARVAEASEKAKGVDVKTLALEARAMAMNDALLSLDENKAIVGWIKAVVESKLDDDDKRIWLATYLCSGTLTPLDAQ